MTKQIDITGSQHTVFNGVTTVEVKAYHYDFNDACDTISYATQIAVHDGIDECDPDMGYAIAFWKAVKDLATRELRRNYNYLDMKLHNRLHSEHAKVSRWVDENWDDDFSDWPEYETPEEVTEAVTNAAENGLIDQAVNQAYEVHKLCEQLTDEQFDEFFWKLSVKVNGGNNA